VLALGLIRLICTAAHSEEIADGGEDIVGNGPFAVAAELMAWSIVMLKFAGLAVTAERIFDLFTLAEVYKEAPLSVVGSRRSGRWYRPHRSDEGVQAGP